MRYVLENDVLRVEVDSFGAELRSVKSNIRFLIFPLMIRVSVSFLIFWAA